MTDVTFEVRVSPDLLNFGLTQDQVQQNVREWLVLSLFTDGVISSGKAAKLLGITRPDFLALLQKRGIAYIDYSPEELQDEFAAVRQLDAGKTP